MDCTPLSETAIISGVFNRLVSEESPQCLVLVVDDKKKEIMPASGESIAVVSFGTTNISGGSLTQAGEMCPHHVLYFDEVKVALEFLNIHEKNLRFLNMFYYDASVI